MVRALHPLMPHVKNQRGFLLLLRISRVVHSVRLVLSCCKGLVDGDLLVSCVRPGSVGLSSGNGNRGQIFNVLVKRRKRTCLLDAEERGNWRCNIANAQSYLRNKTIS